MKFYVKPFLSMVVLVALLGYSSCNKPPRLGPTEEELQLDKLSGTWKVTGTNNVTLDAVSKKTDYSNFTLTVTGTPDATSFGYTTSGRPALSAWPASGTWAFASGKVLTTIKRDPGGAKEVEVTYTVTETTLELSFTYTGAGETRTNKVTGLWSFQLTKQ